jgi:hypothetical protein
MMQWCASQRLMQPPQPPQPPQPMLPPLLLLLLLLLLMAEVLICCQRWWVGRW